MPYMIVKDGQRFCVHKKNDNGSQGERVACHSTEDKAKRQMAALMMGERERQDMMGA